MSKSKKRKNQKKQSDWPPNCRLNQKDDELSFQICSFLKEQPTAIFTLIAGAVTVLSFFSNLSIFLYDQAYLSMWHIDGIYISTSTPLRFYRVCFILLFMISTVFLYVVFRDYVLGSYVANWKKAIFTLCLFSFSGYCLMVTSDASSGVAGMAVLFAGLTLLLALMAVCMRFWILFKISIRWKREKKTKGKSQASENGCETSKDGKKETGAERSSRFSDKSIGRFFARLIMCCLLVLAFYMSLGTWAAELEKAFPVVHIDSECYVVLYNTGDRMILEECDIQDGVITQIYKDKQKIVSVEGIEYEIMDYIPESETDPTQPSETEGTAEETT